MIERVVNEWWGELERLERILACVGPDEVCCEGLTARQTGILRILVAREGARLSDLAAASRLTPSAMTRVLDKLEKQGLVQRRRGSQPDGRAAMVRITAAGRKARARIDQLMRERTRAVVGTIPEPRREPVLRALREFCAALEASNCCGVNNSLVQIPTTANRQPKTANGQRPIASERN